MTWESKEKWIGEGCEGAILCDSCPDFKRMGGFGFQACGECEQAWRKRNDGKIEFYIERR